MEAWVTLGPSSLVNYTSPRRTAPSRRVPLEGGPQNDETGGDRTSVAGTRARGGSQCDGDEVFIYKMKRALEIDNGHGHTAI